MIKCTNCGNGNREGLLFCEECGQNLSSSFNATLPTRQLENDPDDSSAKATWGSARFGNNSKIILHVRDSSEPIKLEPEKKMVLGRYDTSSPTRPDVDFTPYGALDKGVSRSHAVIELSEDTLTLVDAGSSNGTYLNGQRLVANQPRVLRDGDEIRLGKLIAHIYFEQNG